MLGIGMEEDRVRWKDLRHARHEELRSSIPKEHHPAIPGYVHQYLTDPLRGRRGRLTLVQGITDRQDVPLATPLHTQCLQPSRLSFLLNPSRGQQEHPIQAPLFP